MTDQPEERIQIRSRLQEVEALPVTPAIISLLLGLKANPDAAVKDLADVVNQDPSLAAQIMRLANSAYYGYRSEVRLLEVAISTVLGYELVLDLALGLSTLRPLRMKEGGALGVEKLRFHSVICGAVCEQLARCLDPETSGVRPNMAFLVGLLHDIGYLVLGNQFPQELELVAKRVEQTPDLSPCIVERQLLDMSHCELGGWLMERWQLPAPVIVACREHHNPEYEGSLSGYALIVNLADQLLGFDRDGPGAEEVVMYQLNTRFGLTHEHVAQAMAKVISRGDELTDLARKMK